MIYVFLKQLREYHNVTMYEMAKWYIASFSTISINLWKLDGEFDNPNESRVHSYSPLRHVNADFGHRLVLTGSARKLCYNPVW